jgi:radical SAM superfamily enzyme YgiQ (UPF0313 family)
MKIVLIYPYFLEARIHGAEEVAAVPMGLYYLGAVLRHHGYAVQILNWHDRGGQDAAMARELEALEPDLVGLSVLHANRWGAIDIARLVRRHLPRATVVLGGIGASFLWEHLLAHFEEIDAVVVGEGEETLLAMVRHLERSGGLPARLPGLALRREGKPLLTAPPRRLARLDRLPDPARYFDFQHLAMTRGCPGRCTFCGSPRFWGRRVRFHSADYVVDQIERLYRRGITFFYFCDDTFTLSRRRVQAVCRRILERDLKITWVAISKVNCVDAETLTWMRRAGCVQISFGIESGSPAVRRLLCKDIGEDAIRTAFALATGCGILARAYFIYGCPGESRATIDQTLALMDAIAPLAAIFYVLDLFPGTALYADFQRRTGATDAIWLQRIEDILYYETDPALTRDQVLEFGRTLRRHFYGRLPAYALGLRLGADPALAGLQADFLSRLALTFHQGDYARRPQIPESAAVAEALYRRALALAPDARASLGLGMLLQQRRQTAESIAVLETGLRQFPNDGQIRLCLAVSRMNAGDFRRALELLDSLGNAPQAEKFRAICLRALGLRAPDSP